MPALWNREVDDYKVDVFHASTLNYNRAIRVVLKPSGSSSEHTVAIRFTSPVPGDFVNIGSSFSQIQMPDSQFDEVYHLLQTEKPVF